MSAKPKIPDHCLSLSQICDIAFSELPEVKDGSTTRINAAQIITGKSSSTVAGYWNDNAPGEIPAHIMRLVQSRIEWPVFLNWIGGGRFYSVPVPEEIDTKPNGSTLDEMLDAVKTLGDWSEIANTPVKEMNSEERKKVARISEFFLRLHIALNSEIIKEDN